MSEIRRKVLTAMRAEGGVAVERALGRYVEVVPAHTYDQAVRRLGNPHDIGLILCGIYFQETRMFDLLRFARQSCPKIPFICCRIGQTEVPRVTLEALAIAAKSMGAEEFVDLPLLRSDPAVDEEFRRLVLRHLR